MYRIRIKGQLVAQGFITYPARTWNLVSENADRGGYSAAIEQLEDGQWSTLSLQQARDMTPVTFNGYVDWRKRNAYQGDTIIPINGERAEFHEFAGPDPRPIDDWHMDWDHFVGYSAASAERTTQLEALV